MIAVHVSQSNRPAFYSFSVLVFVPNFVVLLQLNLLLLVDFSIHF